MLWQVFTVNPTKDAGLVIISNIIIKEMEQELPLSVWLSSLPEPDQGLEDPRTPRCKCPKQDTSSGSHTMNPQRLN